MARAEITTTKGIRSDQLKSELDGADVFTSEGVVQAEGVTAAALQTAVDAHVIDPDFGKSLEDREFSALRARAVQVFSDPAQSFTPRQMQRILAALVLRATR